MKPVEVLMVEDNRGDVVLVQAAIEKAGLAHRVTVVSDGAEAVEFLRRRGKYAAAPRPGPDHAGLEAAPQERPGSAGGNPARSAPAGRSPWFS